MSEPKGLPERRAVGIAFVYDGQDVTFDDRRLINLTQMWDAAGRPANKDPREWRRKEGRGFIEDLARSLNVAPGHIIQGQRGKGGATWAHWQIAVAYAKHLSHAFHRYVNEAFREWAEEKADPDLKARRAVEGYRRKGWDDRRIRARLDGIVNRNTLTETLHEHEVRGTDGFAGCTNAINKGVLGKTAIEYKRAKGVSVRAKTRDHMEAHELAAIALAEALADKGVRDEDARGNQACAGVCSKAGFAVGTALKMMASR